MKGSDIQIGYLFQISFKQRDLKKKLRVIFNGEPGIDLGGVSKEWFVLLMQKLYNADFGKIFFDFYHIAIEANAKY